MLILYHLCTHLLYKSIFCTIYQEVSSRYCINPSIVGPYVGEFAWYQIVFICYVLTINPYTYFISHSSIGHHILWIICELVLLLELSIGLKLYVNSLVLARFILRFKRSKSYLKLYQIPQSNPFNVAILNHRLHVVKHILENEYNTDRWGLIYVVLSDVDRWKFSQE